MAGLSRPRSVFEQHRMLSVHFSRRFIFFIYVLEFLCTIFASFRYIRFIRAILFDLILIECFLRRLNSNTARIHEWPTAQRSPHVRAYSLPFSFFEKIYNNYGERWITTNRGCGGRYDCGAHLLNRSRWALVRSCFGLFFFVLLFLLCSVRCFYALFFTHNYRLNLFNFLFENNSIKNKLNVGARGSPLIKRHFFFSLCLFIDAWSPRVGYQ